MKNEIKEFYKTMTDFILLNLLIFIVSILGVFVTFGAALTAAYNVAFKLLDRDRQTYVVKDFYISFKENFVKATITWLIIVVVLVGLFFINNYASNTNVVFIQIAVYIALLEIAIFTSYYFPLLSVFKGTNLQIAKNSLLLGHGNIKTTILQLGNASAVFLLVTQVHSMLILVAVGLYLFLSSFVLRNIVNHYKNALRGEQDELHTI